MCVYMYIKKERERERERERYIYVYICIYQTMTYYTITHIVLPSRSRAFDEFAVESGFESTPKNTASRIM